METKRPNADTPLDRLFKGTIPLQYLAPVVIIGDSSVGKTCLLNRYITGNSSTRPMPTMAVEPVIRVVQLRNSVSLKVQFWDTPSSGARYRDTNMLYPIPFSHLEYTAEPLAGLWSTTSHAAPHSRT